MIHLIQERAPAEPEPEPAILSRALFCQGTLCLWHPQARFLQLWKAWFSYSSWHSFIKLQRSWHWKDMESTAERSSMIQNDHPILYCGIIQCHQNGGLLFASHLGLADIPIGTWAALNLLERWGNNFPSAAWGGKPSGYHVSLELKQAVFIGDGCTLENYPMVVWTLQFQGLNQPFITTILGWFTTTGDLCLGATSQPKRQLGSSTAVRWGQDLPEFCPFFRLQAVIDLGSYSTERWEMVKFVAQLASVFLWFVIFEGWQRLQRHGWGGIGTMDMVEILEIDSTPFGVLCHLTWQVYLIDESTLKAMDILEGVHRGRYRRCARCAVELCMKKAPGICPKGRPSTCSSRQRRATSGAKCPKF